MSMGAACLGDMAGPRPRPRPGGGAADGLKGTWTCRNSGIANPAQTASLPHLFNRVTGFVAPPESIRFPMQSLQRTPVVRGRARGVDRHLYFIPHLQRVPLDSLLA